MPSVRENIEAADAEAEREIQAEADHQRAIAGTVIRYVFSNPRTPWKVRADFEYKDDKAVNRWMEFAWRRFEETHGLPRNPMPPYAALRFVLARIMIERVGKWTTSADLVKLAGEQSGSSQNIQIGATFRDFDLRRTQFELEKDKLDGKVAYRFVRRPVAEGDRVVLLDTDEEGKVERLLVQHEVDRDTRVRNGWNDTAMRGLFARVWVRGVETVVSVDRLIRVDVETISYARGAS